MTQVRVADEEDDKAAELYGTIPTEEGGVTFSNA